jgi:hypothetical protein
VSVKSNWNTGDTFNASDLNTMANAVNASTNYYVKVTEYGATGNGTTDDTAAIHAARDAAGVGGTVVFPAGTYKIVGNNDGTGCLQANIAGQVWVITPNATIIQYNHARALITVSAANVTITGGGTLNGGRDTLGDAAYNVSAIIMGTVNSANMTVENIYVTKATYFGIWGQGSHTRVLRCRFYNNYWAEVWLISYYLAVLIGSTEQDTYDMEINGCYVDCTAEDPATFSHTALNIRGSYKSPGGEPGLQYYSYRGKILNNVVILPPGCANTDGNACGIVLGYNAYNGLISGNTVVNGVLGISIPRTQNCRVVDNTVIGGTLAAIELPNAPGAIVQGNVIDGQGTLGSLSSGCGIWIDNTGTTDASIVGNRIFALNANGYVISGGYTSRITVTGNAFESKLGVGFSYMSDFTISNNTFLGNVSGGICVQLVNCNSGVVSGNAIQNGLYGINVAVTAGYTSDYLNISNNHIRGCTTPINAQLSGSGALGTNIVNSGNIVKAS